jgi:hypothetical protein
MAGKLGTRLARLERMQAPGDTCRRCRRLHLGIEALQQTCAGGSAAVGPLCECSCCAPEWHALARRYAATKVPRERGA